MYKNRSFLILDTKINFANKRKKAPVEGHQELILALSVPSPGLILKIFIIFFKKKNHFFLFFNPKTQILKQFETAIFKSDVWIRTF